MKRQEQEPMTEQETGGQGAKHMNRTRRNILKMAALVAAMSILALNLSHAEDKPPACKPNIVVILADDMGYGDLGCYGATKVKTPNLDRLAGAGMRFTDAHSPSAVCSPTRYGLLTGRYAWRTRLKSGVCKPNDPLLIEQGRTTLASMLKSQGYATAVVGKWHLGFGNKKPDWNGDLKPGPLEVGFDYYFGIPVVHGYPPALFVENHRVVGLDPSDPITSVDDPVHRKLPGLPRGIFGDMKGGAEARIQPEHIDDRQAEKAVAWLESVPRTQPLFLYFATSTIHEPCMPNPRYKGTSQCGVRGDCIQEHDWCVGQILDALDRTGRAEDTLVIYSSDNGDWVKSQLYEPEEGIPARYGHKPNGDLRGQKCEIWEGGHRVPLIVRWPGRTPAGKASSELVCLTDVLATCAELVSAPLPDDAGEDSFSFLPVILGQPRATPRGTLVMHGNAGEFAVREGAWKLIVGNDAPNPDASKRPAGILVNLEHDLGEKKNLCAEKPEIVSQLMAQLEKIKQDGRSRP